MADISAEADTLEAWRQAKAEAAKWKDVITALEERLSHALGDDDKGYIGDRLVLTNTWKTVTRFDAKRLRADLPEEVLAPYLADPKQERSGFRSVD
jgi:hypothetical protein